MVSLSSVIGRLQPGERRSDAWRWAFVRGNAESLFPPLRSELVELHAKFGEYSGGGLRALSGIWFVPRSSRVLSGLSLALWRFGFRFGRREVRWTFDSRSAASVRALLPRSGFACVHLHEAAALFMLLPLEWRFMQIVRFEQRDDELRRPQLTCSMEFDRGECTESAATCLGLEKATS